MLASPYPSSLPRLLSWLYSSCPLFTLLRPVLQPSLPLSPLLPLPPPPHLIALPMSTLLRCKMLKLALHPSPHHPRKKQSLPPLQSASVPIFRRTLQLRAANSLARLEMVPRRRKLIVPAFIARKPILLAMIVLFSVINIRYVADFLSQPAPASVVSNAVLEITAQRVIVKKLNTS